MCCKLRKLRNVNKLFLLSYDAGERLDCVYCWTANLNFSHATKFPLYLSFPVISSHFLFKNKQTRKKKREVRKLIKSWVSPGNQTSNLLKKIKEGRALTESRLSRLYVSTSTFSGHKIQPFVKFRIDFYVFDTFIYIKLSLKVDRTFSSCFIRRYLKTKYLTSRF